MPFKNMLANCGMIEFSFLGNPLSWVGNRSNGKVQCRLDRAVGNEDWHHSFSHTNKEYLRLWGSDHSPILTCFLSYKKPRKIGFKFDKRCIGKEGFRDAILHGWNDPTFFDRDDLHDIIELCRKFISRWKRANPSNTAKKIEDIKTQLEQAQLDDNFSNEAILNLKWNLCAAFRDEELYRKQKSRANWLREGDRNIRFFHATTKQRRARNRVLRLRRSNGSGADTEDDMEQVVICYFLTLFTSSNPSDFDESLRYITEKVTPAMNEALTKTPSDDEIQSAMFDINPYKAPGPDEMTSLFFQKYWGITAEVVRHTVKDIFSNGTMDPRLNQTNICLIPKTKRPTEMTEFRPISLCNVSYKVISKVMSNRLRKCLPKIISETQSAFVA